MTADDNPARAQDPFAFLAAAGEMGGRVRSFDWSTTPVGPVADWPQGLKTIVRVMLDSRYAMWLGWGPDLTFFYNDAYAGMTLGPKHPWALGRPAREVWSEIWGDIGPRAESVLRTGRATWDEGLLLFLERRGFPEETYHTFSYSPVPDDRGGVGGMLCVVTEDTERAIGERRLRTLRELAARTTDEAKSVEEACQTAARILAANPQDVPFALLYLLDAKGRRVTLAGQAGVDRGTPISPVAVELPDGTAPWPFRAVAESGTAVEVRGHAGGPGPLPGGAWPEPSQQAVVLPMAKPGQTQLAGFVVAGVSPRRPFDDGYRGFFDLLAGQVATAVSNARAYEEERRRAEQLTELDRAKTAFFSNVSHEFRTPLTLLLGPVEDLLARPAGFLPPEGRESLALAHRSALRLQKLVNTLLDFSRIEAGRVQAVYEPTDLGALTAELASNFRSACEKAGLRLVVDCPPLPEPVYVDHDLWEKVVLNLLSNAFKFTFAGEIAVSVRQAGRHAELVVRDTGAGIPADQVPNLFERFHRVEGARGRTQEGSGIGLALVRELARLHGGEVRAESEVGRGSTFTVAVPLGTAHLPAERLGAARTAAATALGAAPFVAEALRWLPSEGDQVTGWRGDQVTDDGPPPPSVTPPASKPRVLLADDNADMREYVRRLLAGRYAVATVADGVAALDAARRDPPDLILSDVMMPGLDGFGLLRALRADDRTRGLPVLLLSARAGEEARVEGLRAGADDYLTKPFSARELLASVEAHLQMARLRRESEQAVRESEERFRGIFDQTIAGIAQTDLAGRFTLVNGRYCAIVGRPPEELYRLRMQDITHPDDLPRNLDLFGQMLQGGEPFVIEKRYVRPDGAQVWVSNSVSLVRDRDGEPKYTAAVSLDITDRVQAEEAVRASERRFQSFMAHSPATAFIKDAGGRYLFVNRELERRFDRPLGEWVGRTDLELFPPEQAAEFRRNDRGVLAAGTTARFEEVVTQPDGLHHYLAFKFPLQDGNGGWLLAGMALDVTEQKQAQERERRLAVEAATASAQFRAFFEQGALFAGILHVDGTLIEANRLSLEACGYTREQVVGRPFWECPWWDRSPGLQQRIRRAAARAATGEAFRAEVPYFVADGGERVADLIILPIKDEAGRVLFLAPTGTDITDRKRAERELAEAHEFLHSSLDALSSHIAVLDEHGVILAVNDAWRVFADENQFSGHNYGVGANYLAACEPDTGGCVEPEMVRGLKDVLAGRLALFECEYPCHSPTDRRWFVMLATRFKSPGPVRVVVAHEDVTKRRLAEDGLKDADRRKDEFLALLAHELRNPLAPLRNGLQVIRLAGQDRGAVEQARTMMERQLTQLVRIVDDLLDVSRITRNKLELRRGPVELAAVLQSAVETSRPAVEEKGHELTVALPPGPVPLDADLTRLAQVFANLLNNSAKYTPPGGHIRLTAERRGGEVAVSVRDDGIGVPAGALGSIFDMFSQVDRTLERTTGGLGIGLSLVKGLVEMHGGTVEAASGGEGKGSTFTVRLPVAEGGPRRDGPGGGNGAAAAAPGRRVLVVDDNRDSAESLAMFLRLTGNEVRTAHDGLEAVDVAGAYRPDLILMDVGMPRLNGLDATRRIRQQPWGKGVLIVALTGWGQDGDRQKTTDAGCDGHLVKPVDPAALERLLASLEAATA